MVQHVFGEFFEPIPNSLRFPLFPTIPLGGIYHKGRQFCSHQKFPYPQQCLPPLSPHRKLLLTHPFSLTVKERHSFLRNVGKFLVKLCFVLHKMTPIHANHFGFCRTRFPDRREDFVVRRILEGLPRPFCRCRKSK